MKLITNDGENDQKSERKWARGDSRGILTERERESLEQGTVNRHQAFNIEWKTRKAVDDFSLILTTECKPFNFNKKLYGIPFGFNFTAFEQYIQDLIQILYRMQYIRLLNQRKEKGIKRKVQSKEVWKIVNKTLKDAKQNIRRMA
jgi:hypothetical protein